jgi:hypothetical protein
MLLAQSAYSIPFTFDDDGLFIRTIDIYNSDKAKTGEGQIIGIALIDSNENIYYFSDKYPNAPGCTNVKTLDEFYLHSKSKDGAILPCSTLFFNKQNMQEINLKNGIKILTEDSINDVGKYSSYDVMAIITYKDKILGTMGYISPHHDKTKFQSLLQTIKLNNNIKSINEYINYSKETISRGMVNIALKNVASALLLNPSHKDIKPLLQEIYKWQKDFIKHNEQSLENLE